MINRCVLIFLAIIFFYKPAKAQLPEDALRNGWYIPTGTARSTSIGGAMGSLGGEISSITTNPAGLGLYRTREFVITPGVELNSNSNNFRGTENSNSKLNFKLGTVGAVFGGNPSAKPNASSTFAIAVTQTASFNNHLNYSGFNNVSSSSEQYLEQLVNDGADTLAALYNYPFGSSLAYYTYLIDTTLDEFGNFNGYKSQVPLSSGVIQSYDNKQQGGIYEVSLAAASNNSDHLYVGGTLGIPISTYKSNLHYTETDATDDGTNNFNYYTYHEDFTSTGVGINAKLGLIYRFNNSLRLGAAIHTPSFMMFKDKLHSDMTTDTEDYAGVQTANSNQLGGADGSNYEYNELTPWKAMISASYVFNDVENTKLQTGFITADIEYVNYKSARFYQQGSQQDDNLDQYYNSLNDVIKSYYQGAINLRIGGELKFAPWAIRLGGAYYGSPYQDSQLKASKVMAAGGFGYRNNGFFVDVTVAEIFNKDVNFPYRLNDKANTYAELKNNQTNIILTAGIKF